MEIKSKKNILSAEYENIILSRRKSFYVGTYHDSFFRRPWHYHPEFELLLITKGFGTRMVGDHFERFESGDLVLLGGNLPHAWISNPCFLKKKNNDGCESVFVQFRQDVLCTHFVDIPEMESVRIVLSKAARGIKITGKYKKEIKAQMLLIKKLPPIEQLLSLIRMLDWAFHSDYRILSSEKYGQQGLFKSEKITKIHHYMMQNFKNQINVHQCAEYLGMTTTSFCRLLKKQSNMTFSQYLNSMRINLAQKLLLQTQMPIKEIAFECGYISIGYFNQCFKQQNGISPKEYRSGKNKIEKVAGTSPSNSGYVR